MDTTAEISCSPVDLSLSGETNAALGVLKRIRRIENIPAYIQRPTANPSPSNWKCPKQTRALHTVAAILEAAEIVISEVGVAATTTGRVAEVAGVSIGSFYRYFRSKDHLLLSVMLVRIQLFVEAMTFREDCSTEEMWTEMVKVWIQITLELSDHLALTDRLYQRHAHTLAVKTRQIAGEIIQPYLERHAREFKIDNPEAAAIVLGSIVDYMIIDTAIEHPGWLADGTIQNSTVDFILRFLNVR